jgi:hypothetical protein
MDDDGIIFVDLEQLTVNEIEQIEELTGEGIDIFGHAGTKKGKTLRAGGLVFMRRTDPSFTWEQAGNLRVRFGAKPVPPHDGDDSEPAQLSP